jgi:hypothetical protein
MDRRPPPVPPPPPSDPKPAPEAQGAQQTPWVAVPDEKPFRDDVGVAEAAPPPYDPKRDGPIEAPVKELPFRHDHGIAEAAPPPYDRYRHDGGIAEAAPPPYERYPREAAPLEVLQIRTTPALPLTLRGRPITGPFTVGLGDPALVLGDATSPIRASLRIFPHPSRGPTLRVYSSSPLTVTVDGKAGRTPWSMELPRAGVSRATLQLEDPATGAKVAVTLLLRP